MSPHLCRRRLPVVSCQLTPWAFLPCGCVTVVWDLCPQVLKDCSWEVKKGERVGLVGVNGAGKTTQLQIVMGKLQPDSGEVIKAKKNMKIAYLAQEFDVNPSRTVREEFNSVYGKQLEVMRQQEQLSKDLETVGACPRPQHLLMIHRPEHLPYDIYVL